MGAALDGHRVVFTGQGTIISRANVRQIVSEAGGTTMGAVTPETTLLVVCGPEAVSERKIAQARKHGVKTITERQFVDLLERA